MGEGMNCEWVRQRVGRILDGEYAGGAVGKELSEHLLACSDCERLLRLTRENGHVLHDALPEAVPPRDLTPEIMATVASMRKHHPTSQPLRRRLVLSVAAAAAVAMVALVLRLGTDRVKRGDAAPAVALAEGAEGPSAEDATQSGLPPPAVLCFTAGTVEVIPELGGARPAEPGTTLPPNTIVRTAARSSADLVVGEDIRVRFDSDSQACVRSSFDLFLSSGRLFVWVTRRGSRFSVATAQSRSEIQGTEFCVDARRQGRTALTVVEGTVSFANQHGTVEVGAGLQSEAVAGVRPTPGRPTDVSAAIAWLWLIGFRARLDQSQGQWVAGIPAIIAELEWPDMAEAALWLSCEVTDLKGRTVSKCLLPASTSRYRFLVRRFELPGLAPGLYRAAVGVVEDGGANQQLLEFEVE